MKSKRLAVAGIAILISVCGSNATVPPSTRTVVYKQGNNVLRMGQINSPFFASSAGAVGGTSFLGLAINDAGDAYVTCGIFAPQPFTQAVLFSPQGLDPYLGSGLLAPDLAALGLPNADYAVRTFGAIDLNNAGTLAFAAQLGQGDFGPDVTPTSGVAMGKLNLLAQQSAPVTAAGVAPGTTFDPFGSIAVCATDANVFLLGATIRESGVARRALIKVAADASGAVLSQTLVAKEGGPVGAGPETWTALSITPNTAAMNSSGQVAFSGTTSAGVTGIFRDSQLFATSGGASPIAGQVWGSLFGAPLDINNSGNVAFRGFYGTGIWTELGEAGETIATANQTTNGSLSTIVGSLSTDHDVDIYRIRINDFSAFSATTVPSPGFEGSTGDTVLYLFRNFANANGITRIALARSDDAAPGVAQSTITAANIPPDTGNGATQYYLAVATPKSRPVDSGGGEFWLEDPSALAISGDKIYWSDPSEGRVLRADLVTGAIDATSYPVSVVPAPFQGQTLGTGEQLTPAFAVTDAPASRLLVWATDSWADNRLHTSDTDVFSEQDIISGLSAAKVGEITGMAVDNAAGKVYWTRADTFPTDAGGILNRSNLDGGNAEVVLPAPSGMRPRHISIDSTGGKIYWSDSTAQTISRCNLDGSVVETVATAVVAGGLALDAAAGKVYWSVPATGIIERSNLDGASRETFKSGLSATSRRYLSGAIAVSGTNLYYASVPSRSILRMPTATVNPAATTLVSLGAAIGDRTSDSPSKLSSLSAWQRDGTPGSTPISYQVRLTGAIAFNQQSMVAINNTTKVAAVGDTLPDISPATLVTIGDLASPIRLSNNGLVAYRATWGTSTGLFLGRDKVFDNTSIHNLGTVMGNLDAGVAGFDMSDSGQYIMTFTNRSLPNFTAEYLATRIAFLTVPRSPCAADVAGLGGSVGADGRLTPDDIVVYLDAFFAGNLAVADLVGLGGNGGPDGAITPDDLIAFLGVFFSGCS